MLLHSFVHVSNQMPRITRRLVGGQPFRLSVATVQFEILANRGGKRVRICQHTLFGHVVVLGVEGARCSAMCARRGRPFVLFGRLAVRIFRILVARALTAFWLPLGHSQRVNIWLAGTAHALAHTHTLFTGSRTTRTHIS